MDRILSGVSGLDELVGGGIPKSRCVLVVGSPGSGKTTLAMQFLRQGAEGEERALYVTMDESPTQIKENLSSFQWNLDKLEREGKLFFIDATPIRHSRTRTVEYVGSGTTSDSIAFPSDLTLKELIRTVSKVVEEEKIQRIVVDPITSIMLRYERATRRRRAMLMFFDGLEGTGCSSVVTTELRTGMLDREFQLEEFLSQGVILLHTILHEGSIIRAIQIEKMRGTYHDVQPRPYQITAKGVEVFPKDRIFQ